MEIFVSNICELRGLGNEQRETLAEEAVLEYLNSCIGADEEDDACKMDLEDFWQVIQGFCPDLEELDENEKNGQVKKWYDEIYQKDKDKEKEKENQESQEKEMKQTLEKPTKMNAKTNTNTKVKTNTNTTAKTKTKTKTNQDRNTNINNPLLEQLLGILPEDAHIESVRYILEQKCGNKVENAALYIFDTGLDKIRTEFQQHLDEKENLEKAEEIEKIQLKSRLMQQFDEYCVVEAPGKKKNKKANSKQMRQQMKQAQQNHKKEKDARKVRYFDGKVVSRNGEKYHVVDDGKQEWNGGSKGRVMTKGKRGPGWVSG